MAAAPRFVGNFNFSLLFLSSIDIAEILALSKTESGLLISAGKLVQWLGFLVASYIPHYRTNYRAAALIGTFCNVAFAVACWAAVLAGLQALYS